MSQDFIQFVNTVFVPGGLMLIMFSMGLTLALRDFGMVVRHPVPVAAGFATHLLLLPLRQSWADREGRRYFKGTHPCLSSLLAAGRHEELLSLLEKAPFVGWSYRRYGVQALAALGRLDEALAYAEASRGLNDNPARIAATCEALLLAAGRAEEAYDRYALAANQQSTYLATFRALA